MEKQFQLKMTIAKDDNTISSDRRYTVSASYDYSVGNVPVSGCGSIGESLSIAMARITPMIANHFEEEFQKMVFETGMGEVRKPGCQPLIGNIPCPATDKPINSSLDQETLNSIKSINEEFCDKQFAYPPLGLRPEMIWKGNRLSEVKEAIQRYIEVDKDIPAAWIKEHDILDREITEYNVSRHAASLNVGSLEAKRKVLGK